MRTLGRLAPLGYVLAGTARAVGIAVPLVLLNNYLQGLLRDWFGPSAPVLLLQGTLLAVLIAYLARFLTVGFNRVESGLQRITRNIDEVAASLGVVGTQLIRKVHVPLLRTSLATAATL